MIGRSPLFLGALLLAAIAASPPIRSNDASPPHVSAAQNDVGIHVLRLDPDYLRIALTVLTPVSATLEAPALTRVVAELGRSQPAHAILSTAESTRPLLGRNSNTDYALNGGGRMRINLTRGSRSERPLANGNPLNRLTNYAIHPATAPFRLRV